MCACSGIGFGSVAPGMHATTRATPRYSGMRTYKKRKYGRYGTWKHAAGRAEVAARSGRSGRNGENMHVIVERPGADPRACARVERIKVLVRELLDDPGAARVDPTATSLAVHMAAGWLGETRGFETGWEEFDARAFIAALPRFACFDAAMAAKMRESLCFAFEWMGEHGRLEPAFAARVVGEILEGWPREMKPPSAAAVLASMFGFN